MGRKRKEPTDNKLPPRVYKTKYCYYFKPTSKESISLGLVSMSMSDLWKRYEEEIKNNKDKLNFSALWQKFLHSAYFMELKPRTQSDYVQHQKKLLAVFGKVKADSIKPEHVREFMDKRGLQSKTQANHEMSSMSRVYRWGYERGYVKGNPCLGVSKFKSVARDRYITNEEYETIYRCADTTVKVAMEISYLCAARLSDVIGMKWSQVTEHGVFIQQGKTGTKQIKAWSNRLKLAFDLAKQEMQPVTADTTVIKSSHGGGFTRKGFSNRWESARAKAAEKLGYALDCTFHDIKAKGISDYEGSTKDKQLFSGHKTEGQVLVYDRKLKISPSLDIDPIK